MALFSTIFIIMVLLSAMTHFWLALRQIKHVKQHREQTPEAFAEKISLEEHQKAADYTIAKEKLGNIELFIGTTLVFIWTLGGGLEFLDQYVRTYELEPLYAGVFFILLMGFISAIIDMPIGLYNTFVLEEKFGFNRTSFKVWLVDLVKQSILGLVIGIPLIMVILWLMSSAGEFWWLYAWAVWMGFGFLMMWAYPAFIAPIFNKFTELEEGSLKQRIEQLMTRCGFLSKGILVMDGSKRSSHGNAYFTGLGNNKQIVFFDNLLDSLDDEEVEAVLAHELGHFKKKHIIKRLFTMTFMTLAGFAMLGWLMQQEWFYNGLGMTTPSIYAALVLFSIASPAFTFFLSPISAMISRKHEFEADDYAAQQSDANKLIEALVKLYKENANTLTPDPLHSAYYDSHPPAPVRIAHLNNT
ncbi:MAG: M48 family metallopeptidase [gamma proteobacterium symbiont of Bathyaustriella thionipta]|nr:M48 family metallopeptidase [gamma proteobacterium symbiont of Bathyaustriella thionipta]MCU7949956.1 M48 family metallopeptidase [gamma proteobacterium symbiont of Bathyaustriella thionipta]MCU7954698.1 M48 family metallopeptidase [gamma proteobacterium symbiont of Bathyaustriella thionipta]MCU7956521.1 M48 family metallopeptidase [gamma proteobacterium symbiont of Bathyaustriella thionipta]MCU7967948.1 M48 family metallopeptidase [gamma proteobacterium symbiont of Bathyaustriella thionipta